MWHFLYHKNGSADSNELRTTPLWSRPLSYLFITTGLITRILWRDSEVLTTLANRNGEAVVLCLTVLVLSVQVFVGLGKESIHLLTVAALLTSYGV